ncbi:unnamed protein product [Rotaria magnacalcarata]|uniref:Uncharacterized protein n=1 Tax=Rotaria magnacalcarata TaxID=392030 RepID=A0A816NXQ9_9BILA|nr:unnamed protein product [Rotaria magnacalcarata]CAF3924922.1 unnamed protein product [Rotaria magnacalcarata]
MTTVQQLHPDLEELSQVPNTIFYQIETAIKTSTKLTDGYRKQCLQACCEVKDSFFRAQIDFTNEGQRLITRAMELPVTDEKNRRILHGEWQKMMNFTKAECKLILEPVQQIVQYLLKTDRKLLLKCFALGGTIALKDLVLVLLVIGLVVPHCAACAFTVPIWGWIGRFGCYYYYCRSANETCYT